jgi:hypothetical protein
MSQCPECVAGIGQVTKYLLGKYVTIVCPTCRGVGRMCGVCKRPDDLCICPPPKDEDEDE